MLGNFKVGEVVYNKCTEEPCLVVARRKLATGDKRFPVEYDGTGNIIVVQRPVIADGGVQRYEFYDFLEEALESETEQVMRRVRRLKEGNALFAADEGSSAGGGPALVRN